MADIKAVYLLFAVFFFNSRPSFDRFILFNIEMKVSRSIYCVKSFVKSMAPPCCSLAQSVMSMHCHSVKRIQNQLEKNGNTRAITFSKYTVDFQLRFN